jgi:hypothetical protein
VPPKVHHHSPGQSPFHVKGLIYARTHMYFTEHVEGGPAAVVEHLPSEALRTFFQQTFVASTWYDALPMAPLIQAEAKACGQPVKDYLAQRAGWQAEQDIHTVYRLLLKLASPAMVAARLPTLISRVIDFGAPTILERLERQLRLVVRGMPDVLGEWYSGAMTAYGERALSLAGAKTPSVFVESAAAGEVVHGVPTSELTFCLTW